MQFAQIVECYGYARADHRATEKKIRTGIVDRNRKPDAPEEGRIKWALCYVTTRQSTLLSGLL